VFFYELPNYVYDPRAPLGLLADLRDSGAPPTAEEVGFYVKYQTDRKRYGLAREAWETLLPAVKAGARGLLFNGRFEFPPSGVDFDWRFKFRGGVRVDIADSPVQPKGRALRLEFLQQLINELSIEQTTTLSPGTYVLTGRKTGVYAAKRGLVWRVACVERPSAPIAESAPLNGAPGGWATFAFPFAVPAKGCDSQIVSLGLGAVSDSERIVSGQAWIADLSIAPGR
jgi:hypothetical protein